MNYASRKIEAIRSEATEGQDESSLTLRPTQSQLDLINYKLAIDSIPDGISVHSVDGKVLHANERLAQIYGLTVSEMIGLGCQQVFHTAEYECPHEEVISTGKAIQVEAGLKIGDRSFNIAINPMRDNGNVTGYVRVMRDITDRRMAHEQLLKAERFATLGQMISGIAHDVGTPLNIISGYSEYLLMRTKPDAQGHKELSTILQQTRRIADFIKQMLDLARPPQPRADAIGLKGFLSESIDLIGHHFRKADVKASFTCNIDSPLIYGDAPRLRQALFNLILNVTQQLAPSSRLEIILDEAASDPDFVEITLLATDSLGRGHDFSCSLLGFLQGARSAETLGLGLSLARNVFDGFGARVDTSDVGERGVALVVSLPKNSKGLE